MLNFIAALKYSFSKHSGQRTTSKMILISILLSVFSLIIIIGVLNGLQSSQLDLLRTVESFDVSIKDTSLTKQQIENATGCNVYEYKDAFALMSNETYSQSIRIRGIDSEYFSNPRTFDSVYLNGIFDDGLCLSFSLINNLSIIPGQEVKITILKKGKTATLVPFDFYTYAKNTYSSSLYDFSKNTVYMDIEELNEILEDNNKCYGILSEAKSSDIKDKLLELDKSAEVYTWQESNNAVYSALLLEKTLVYVFLAFIVLIILVSMNNSTRRMIKTKATESTILRSMGITEADLRLIYIEQALLITVPGCIAGALAGILLVSRIDVLFNFIGKISTALTGHLSVLSMIPFNAYISFKETSLIVLTVLLLTVIFTLIAMKEFKKNSILGVLSDVCN